MIKEKKDCLTCSAFLPFKIFSVNKNKSITVGESGYCLNEKSKYYCDKIVGKGIVCGFWSDTPPKGEGNDEY